MIHPFISRVAAVAVLALAPALVLAADAQAQLKAFVAKVQTATGHFSQSTVGPQGRTQPAQSGMFAFQRPGKFKWAIERPYEQLIIADGKEVFQYDPDLAQVTVRKVDQAIGTSPAAILFGAGDLDQAFRVTALPEADGLQWLRAIPRDADAGFSQVDIGMRNDIPARIELLDTFGQVTRVELSGIDANPQLSPTQFQFSAPAGVDVVRM